MKIHLSFINLMIASINPNASLLKAYGLFLALTFTAILSFGQTPVTRYKITGHTSATHGKARLLLYTNSNQFIPYDSIDIRNGTFIFSGTLNEPKSFQLLIRNKSRILFVGNENIQVNDMNEKTGAITVSGSKLSNDYDYYFNRWIAPLISRLQKINQKLDSLDATHQKEIDSLTRIQGSLFKGVPDSSVVFIRHMPASFVSLYLLNYYAASYSVDTIKSLFASLNANLKQYPSANYIKQKIQLNPPLFAKCPAFSVTDKNGENITSETFKGNYLLIHFWANWDNAYAKNLSLVQKVADRFQHQNFKVLTISLDNDTSTWKAALKKYHLDETCRNVYLPNQFKNPMALQFDVSTIPRTVLIDPDGNIIETNIDGQKLEKRLEKIFTISVDGNDDVALLQSGLHQSPECRSVWYKY